MVVKNEWDLNVRLEERKEYTTSRQLLAGQGRKEGKGASCIITPHCSVLDNSITKYKTRYCTFASSDSFQHQA